MIDVLDELPGWSAPFGLKLLDSIDYRRGITALDIGFGTGFPLTEIAMRLGETATVYGIDPWSEAIERAKRKIALYRIGNIRLIEGYAESIPLQENTVDLITSNNGINNTGDIDGVFAECSRVIKTGGQFLQTMNLDWSMFEFYRQFEKALSDLGMHSGIEMMHKHIEAKRPPLHRIISMLEKHRFAVRAVEHDQFNYRFIDGTAMLNHYFIRIAFMDSWFKLLPEEKAEQVFDSVESALNRESQRTGCMNLSIPFVLIDTVKL